MYANSVTRETVCTNVLADTPDLIKSNFVTCSKYNKCRPYCEMLTYKPNSAVQERVKKIFTQNIYAIK